MRRDYGSLRAGSPSVSKQRRTASGVEKDNGEHCARLAHACPSRAQRARMHERTLSPVVIGPDDTWPHDHEP
ncbi:hypothetical protein PsYK624_114900 [Phanerochaete sordida]|uniref:Uncharacterized protein n=1 Tax=Phanerochaete sordida TaxID=48140 RepID=A0A9P3LH93_9APHY|nr:hypothetical protein PsYK624_114900 [Phanerochaete sordida]